MTDTAFAGATSRRLPSVLASFLLVAGLGWSACARPADDAPSAVASQTRAADPVARTLEEGTASVRIEFRADTPGARPFVLSGATALDGSRSNLRFDARELGIPIDGPADGEYRTVDGRTWLRPPAALLPLPPGKRWVELSPGGPSLGLLSVLGRPPSLEGDDREVDGEGRITAVRRFEQKPGAPGLLTVIRFERFRTPVRVAAPPAEEVVSPADL